MRFIIVLMAAGCLAAQRAPVPDKPYIQATGEGTITAKPDQAIIDIGVVTQAPSAESAATQNAKQTDAVLADLRKAVSSSDQIKTMSYSVRPNYQTPKPGSTPTISGYTATNVVEVKLDDLTRVGKVIDAALKSGANNIQSLRFELKNPQAAQSQALKEAAVQARANADAIAAGLGLHIVRVLSAEEPNTGGARPRSFALAAADAGAIPSTQVEAGTIEVNATVTLRVEVSQ